MDRHVPPGSRFKRQNVINVTPIRTGIVCSTRFPMILKLGERDQSLSISQAQFGPAEAITLHSTLALDVPPATTRSRSSSSP
jgi:hypothetical protein